MNEKLPPINKTRQRKKEQIKEDKIKESICRANDNWNVWKFQLYWDNLEWVDSKSQYRKTNPFCTSSHKFYIKYENESFHFFGH